MASNSDLQKWQQAITGIMTAQDELSPDELSAFQVLVSLINSGNFESSKSGGNIRIIKNALKQHGKNRLLKTHLKNFVALCDKHFKGLTAEITEPQEQQTETFREKITQKTDSSRKGNRFAPIMLGIVMVVLLLGGYFAIKDSQWFNYFFVIEKEQGENVNIEETTLEEEEQEEEQEQETDIQIIVNPEPAEDWLESKNESKNENKTDILPSKEVKPEMPVTEPEPTPEKTPSSVASNIQTQKIAAPTTEQLNDLLHKITNADDQATDEIRSVLGNNLPVEGAPNISNVQQLITDVSNGSYYKVTKVDTDADGKVVSISVSK